MSALTTRADLEQWLKPILARHDITNYTLNIKGNSEKGDGYLGDITFVEVSSTLKNHQLVIKSGKRSDKLRETVPVRFAFENEIFVYDQVLPTFKRFQDEKEIKEPFKNFPKSYGTWVTEDMEVLVLEDLKERGFSVWDKKNPLPLDYIKEVVKTYGKLHAISFAIRNQKPELFQELISNLGDLMNEFNEMMEISEDFTPTAFDDIIKVAEEKGDLDIVEKAKFMNGWLKNINKLTDPTDPFAVILHGDCWNNNFLFKYEKSEASALPEPCLIDWQICRLASPVFDLSYFLFTCLSQEDVQHFDKINDIYYESLSTFLRKLGSDPNKLFPYEELLNQWKKYAKFGLVMMPSILKLCLASQEDLPDLIETAESGTKLNDAFSFRMKNTGEYGKRGLAIMRLAIDRGFV